MSNPSPCRVWIFGPAVIILLFAIVAPSPANAQDKVELFGGFSYVRANVTSAQFAGTCPIVCPPPVFVAQHPNLYGWEFSGAYKLVPFLSANLDFGEQYGKLNGGNVRLKTYLFGPQLSLPGPVSPFVHAEFGIAHESVGSFSGTTLSSPGSDTAFATALGGGLDIKALPFFAVRVVQVDYLRTSLYHRTQNQPRVSAGIVFRF
jgi:hypothetical protein